MRADDEPPRPDPEGGRANEPDHPHDAGARDASGAEDVAGAVATYGGDEHPPSPDRPVRDGDASVSFGLFAFLLALALILHQLWWNGFEVPSAHFVVIVAALWVMGRPTSVTRFLLMLAAEVVAVALDLPYVGDHTLLVLVTGACVLGDVGWTGLLTRGLPEPGALFERIAPFLRVQLLILYLFAALAKMNTAFFDPRLSCAASMSRQVVWFDPRFLEGSWPIVPAIWGTVGIEAALPVLLAVPRTRVLGVMVGLAFHTVLAFAGNVPFSALALALYVAFLPPDTPSRLRVWGVDHPGVLRWTRRAWRWGGSPVAVVLAVGCWVGGGAVFGHQPAAGGALFPTTLRLVVVLGVIFLGMLLIAGRARGRHSHSSTSAPGARRLEHPVFIAGMLLLVLNGLSPYLGLKTESTFTMFSNLRTEDGYWNHLFLPDAIRVFGYQNEPVSISGSNDPALLARTRDGTALVRFELDRYLKSHPTATATVTTTTPTGGKTQTAATSDPSMARTVLDKLVRFKDVRPPELGGC